MTTKTQTPTHTVDTLEHPAPNGECAVKVTCFCSACSAKSAIVRESYAEQHKMTATHVHNLVQMAHSPLQGAPQVKANGPWAA